jgi:hypothetical protein
MPRPTAVLATTVALVLAGAPNALAAHGMGLIKDANDKVVTNAGFILLIGFPLLISLLSFVQWRLDKRKQERKAAQKNRLARPEWRGGW